MMKQQHRRAVTVTTHDKRMTVRTGYALICALGLTGLGVACDSGDTNQEDASAANTSTSGVGGAGGTTSSTTSDGGAFNPSQSGGSTGQGGDGCLTTESAAEQKPLDMVLVIDRSDSMAGTLWDGTVQALDTFLTDPTNTGVSAAINYFPPPSNPDECNPSSYNPTHVALASLSTNGAALSADVSSQTPDGSFTPTYGALYGSLQYANLLQNDNPDRVVVVVLASDGDPTMCNTVVSDIAGIAQVALEFNGVRTFAVAIQGATIANLDEIAAAGGTGQAIDVTSDVTELGTKLTEIRATLACEFDIPEPTGGQPFDPAQLNIDYTPGDGSSVETIPQVDGASSCGNGDGWYYNNPNMPTKVIFCPDTCDRIKQDVGASVRFVFGCPTVIQ